MLITYEHKEIYRQVKTFVEKELNPHVAEWEKAGIWPAHEVLKKMGGLGLLGISKPEAYGGMGLDYSYEIMFAQALGNCLSGSISMGIGVQTDMATPALARFGSEELKKEYLAPALAGDMVVSIAVSEAGAGSDVASIKTSARKEGGDYVINGSKMWITNAAQADWLCLLVNTSDGAPHINKTLVIVPTKLRGLQIGAKIEKLGLHASDTCPVFFEDVRVPQRNRIGEEGMGFMMQMVQFQEERLNGAIGSTRGMDRLLDAARQERDGAAYQELVKQFVKIAMTDVPVIPLYQPVLDVTMQRSIDGYVYQFHRQVDARTLIRT